MVYVMPDPATKTLGYRIVEKIGDLGSRTLIEEFGFDHPGTLYSFVKEFENSVRSNKIQIGRTSIGYGITIFGNGGNILYQEDGFLEEKDASDFAMGLKTAFNEGIKMDLAPKVKSVNANPSRVANQPLAPLSPEAQKRVQETMAYANEPEERGYGKLS